MVGRFIGSAVLRVVSPGKVLAGVAVGAIALIADLGSHARARCRATALLAIGLMNSIMFPTIFSLACEGLGARAADGSGIINVAIFGGAVVPLLTGMLADCEQPADGAAAAGRLLRGDRQLRHLRAAPGCSARNPGGRGRLGSRSPGGRGEGIALARRDAPRICKKVSKTQPVQHERRLHDQFRRRSTASRHTLLKPARIGGHATPDGTALRSKRA